MIADSHAGLGDVLDHVLGHVDTREDFVGYGLTARMDGPYLGVLNRVRMALVEQQFTILTETEVSRLLDDRLGIETPPQTTLGVCSVPALRALIDVEPSFGLLVPTPVVVRAHAVDVTVVEAANPRLLVATTGHPGLESVAADVAARMAAVFATLSSQPTKDRLGSAKAGDDVVAVERVPRASAQV